MFSVETPVMAVKVSVAVSQVRLTVWQSAAGPDALPRGSAYSAG
jgi:hypothetical protein